MSSLAFFAVSIVSLIILNIASSLLSPNNNDHAKAEPDGPTPPTQSLSLSISNNIELSIPKTGGTVSNYHDLTIQTTNITNGYSLTLTTSTSNNKLTNTNNSNKTINPTTNTKSNPNTLQNNTWGYSISNRNSTTNFNPTTYSQVLPNNTTNNTDKQIANTTINDTTNPTTTDTYRVAYAVRIDNPSSLLSGKYINTAQYTLTANPIPAPTITSISPDFMTTTEDGVLVEEDGTITIRGANLKSTYDIRIGQVLCTNINVISDNEVTCQAPTHVAGQYDMTIKTLGGIVTKTAAVAYEPNSICRSGNLALSPSFTNDCTVDLDANMIPVKYAGNQSSTNTGWVKADLQIAGDWYDYNNQKWANAVTVANPDKYKDAAAGTAIASADIKGYWVYIPRYAYEVMRRDAVDKVANAQNFRIRFERAADIKKTPKPCNSTATNHIDYRTGCSISRKYPRTDSDKNNTTWATHPAFTWGDEELNGLWIGKFELTGSRTAPTILPNQIANINETVGSYTNIIKSIGIDDPNNTGGGCSGYYYGCLSTVTQYNQHKLDKSSSHMLKNSEWGAAAYLSASQYGAGVNRVRVNSAVYTNTNKLDADGAINPFGMTGCGPKAIDNPGGYYDNLESDIACGDVSRQYTGSLGQLASTTNNVYGLYDMAGGNWEYVMGNYGNIKGEAYGSAGVMSTGNYIDIYPRNVFSNSNGFEKFDQCTWQYCGGHAYTELMKTQNATDPVYPWGDDLFVFADSGSAWVIRGHRSDGGKSAGIFAARAYTGAGGITLTSRAVLVVN